ncbi:mitochondrial solute carrier protein [Chloropicon primus]|uniref:Mitochondrial solute carrier protein n=2 Tax=Chloropicon primus TaxID=1764295 RepID=A0A5B8MJB5_9CHLO|nr:mitochondrial solute carrier protein [Chloropicon primus]UPQ99727.1 mitochondrial solute carrier protein [Chloropicon primus]|eukprot:QDZ20517.1 mitochondrial solute carrier protein [Chloropicon primus]
MPETSSVCAAEGGREKRGAGEGGEKRRIGAIAKKVMRTYDGLTFSKYMVAGSAAGITEHVAMFPVDTIKTRMQALAVPGAGVESTVRLAMRSIIRTEGIKGLYSGVGAVAIGAGPSHGLYFVVYEYMKSFLGVTNDDKHKPFETGFAAAAATVVADAFMTPLDVVKQRLQLANSPYVGLMDCVNKTLRQEGINAFFRSYNTTLIMNVPFVTIHFAAYESCKKFLRNSADDEGLKVQCSAGGLAGGLAALATNPLDVVKTRQQTDSVFISSEKTSLSSMSVFNNIVKNEGYSALMRGMIPRIMFHVPAAAISWMTYESCKGFFA